MRLGDLLVQAGRVTPDDVEDAARSQVAYGGRLGTNLVELGHLEIDELAAFLGRQHRLPAAQRLHFDQADTALQRQLPAEIAARYKVVPIARLAAESRKIAVASLGPVSGEALTAVAAALGCDQSDLVIAVAAELRILYNLERVYGISRPSRFLRTRRGGTSEIAIAPLPPSEPSSDDDLAIPHVTTEPASEPVTRPVEVVPEPVAEVDSGDVELELAADPTPVETEAAGSERRRFVRTVADSEPPATHPPDPGTTSLGRINLRKLSALALEAARGSTVQDCVRAIRRCRDRDAIGDLAIDLLDRGTGGATDAGVLFIARGPVAVAWKGFARGAEVDFDQLAVPLDEPSVIARATGQITRRRRADDPALTELDQRLIAALGFEPPAFMVATPITIRDHLIGFVYAHGRSDGDAVEAIALEVADATRTALTSLLRAAQR